MKTKFIDLKNSLELYSISAERIGFVPMEVGNKFVDKDKNEWVICSKSLIMEEAKNGMEVYHTPVLFYFLEESK